MQVVLAIEYFSADERSLFERKNAWLASLYIIGHYSAIVSAFALVYVFPNALSILVALFVLGGQQLACSVLMHDASHYAIFENKKINDFVGRWLGAYPLLLELESYRRYHRLHHTHTGLKNDPDIMLTKGYPTSKRSMMRKFTRDLTGVTGVKFFIGTIMLYMGYVEYNSGNQVVKSPTPPVGLRAIIIRALTWLGKPLLVNASLFLILFWLASGWLYLLWIAAYLTTYQFSLRVRSMAEHSMVEDSSNPYSNTRTTLTNIVGKLLFAPYNVNYHAEHHILMGVPSYNFPAMHKHLKAKGFYQKGVLERGYLNIIKKATG